MKPPKTIKVGHHTYRLKFDKDLQAHGVVGRCDSRRLIIYIDPDQAPSEVKETALHEVLHAIWYDAALAYIGTEEENLVSVQSPRLMQFLSDNPDFLAWLMEG